jgi:uracil-DNA glycosylase family 4
MSERRLNDCRRCPRLVRHRREAASTADYWARPVPAAGPDDARLLVVGLAPGAEGANRMGAPFYGDDAGAVLRRRLASVPTAVRITNAVKCLPPQNRPSLAEVRRCQPYLADEILALREAGHQAGLPAVILALGVIAHKAVVEALAIEPGRYRFQHGALWQPHRGLFLLDSYHCSRYNIHTRRLTEPQFAAVIDRAAGLLGRP